MDEGAKFDSFVEFDRAFRDFQVTTNTLFVTKASKTVDIVNSRLSAGLTKLDAKLKFANITYACKHGGAVRKTGSGIRPQQRTMKKDCPAKIIVAARRASQQLEVTAVNLEHNHEVSPETYKAYSECRQLNEEGVNFVRPLIELNVRPNLIVEKLRQETRKAVIAKDIHNLKCARRGQDEATQLMEELNYCKAKYGAKVLPITDENKELQILFFQTPHMQQAFKCFPEVLLLDATYCTNKLRMPLFVMVVQDKSGLSHVVAYAFVASEQQHVVTSLLEIFVQENSAATNTKVVVIDKDFTEVNAVKAAFPGSPAVQLCEFHVKKAFQTAAAQLGKSPDERKRLLGSFSEMLHAPTPQKYDDAKAEFERYASSEATSYFAKNWSNITEMWVRYHCDQEFTEGNNTNNRVESRNAKIKNVLSSSSKLHEALRGLLKLSTSLSQEAHHKTILLKICDFYSYEGHEGVQEQCRKVLTPYACKLLSNELVKLRDEPREVKMLSPRTYAVFSTSTDVWHDVSFEKHSCSCTTYKKMKLLCQHMLAVCARFDVKLCLEEAVSRRWFKSYHLEFLGTTADNHEQDDIDSESTTESSAEIQALSMPGPSFQKMNRNQRFNYAMRMLKAIADNLADCQPDVFAARLGFLVCERSLAKARRCGTEPS
ncbi:uncharacterized protein ZSWIM9-like [Rhipicephalus microplus]|uniref:uncharacterized protein ZSWIM9-like n=1 Tax=Rhipicephalus microplus TaxID=6941 RepID=UPI003F6C0D15